MAEDTVSPLDDAIESVQRSDLDGGTANLKLDDVDPFAAPSPVIEEPPKKRGRPPNPNGRAAQRAARKAGAPLPASGVVKDPPVPEVKPEYAKIDPAAVAQSIRQIDAIIVKLAGTAPLSPEEALAGGGVFAPILDHYMPMIADKGGLWIAPATWVVIAYGPRAYEILERRQQEAKKRPASEEARPGENNGTTTFRRSDSDPASAFSLATQ